MGELINLNRVRKDRAKAEAKTSAAENRVAHGRSKAERAATQAERDHARRSLDGHKREDEA